MQTYRQQESPRLQSDAQPQAILYRGLFTTPFSIQTEKMSDLGVKIKVNTKR